MTPQKKPKNLLLCVDSAQGVASLGLVCERKVLAKRQLANKRDHAERIIDEIQKVLDQAGHKLRDCAAIVTGLGPGSFIGVRIGLATIKGLAFGANIPVIGVSSSAALALSAQQQGRVAVAIDAKKGQVYASAHVVNAELNLQHELAAPQPLAPDKAQQLFASIGAFDLVTGDGFVRYADIFSPLLTATPRPQSVNKGIEVIALATLAQARLANRDFCDLDTLAPHYARRSEAEIKRAQRLDSL